MQSKIRNILNKLKWHDHSLERTKITYLHRGAPNDRASFSGSDILSFSQGFINIQRDEEEASIPFHRIRKIELDGEILYERQ